MTTRTPLVAGNWKLHKTLAEARGLAGALRTALGDSPGTVDVLVAPVATALATVASELEGSRIGVAGQNMHHEEAGAFTGELSPVLLADAGASHVILGHSERRGLFGETDEGVNRKVAAA
ncbi:MAG: triose-phosphate isomerase, partial [Myxococcota bacterium]